MKKTIFIKIMSAALCIVLASFISLGILFATKVKELRNVDETSLNILTDKMLFETDKNLKKTSEVIIEGKTQDIATNIKYFLVSRKKLHNLSNKEIAELQNNKEFTALALQKIGKEGYTVIIDDKDIIRCHPDHRLENTALSKLIERTPEFEKIYKEAKEKGSASGYYRWTEADGKIRNKFIAATKIDGTNLYLCITMYLEEFFAPIMNIKKSNILNIEEYRTNINKELSGIIQWFFLILGFSLIGTIIMIYFCVEKVTRPILSLAKHTQELGKGNLDHKINIATGDEIEFLASKLNEMAIGLKDYYSGLEEVNRKLKQANEELENIAKMKSEFVSIASHELKTPLAVIRGFSDIVKIEALKKGTPDCLKQAGNLEIIIQEADRLAKMVDEFLNISRIESGLIEIELTEIKIQESIKK